MREYMIGLGLVIGFMSFSVSYVSVNHRSIWQTVMPQSWEENRVARIETKALAHFLPPITEGLRQTECDCSQINRDRDKIFVTYERLTRRTSKKKNNTLWLRFHNETNCPIYVPTDHEYIFKNSTGQMTFDIPEGSVVFVKYMVEKATLRKGATESRDHHWVWYSSGTTYATCVPSGSSLLFYVPIANLKGCSYLAVAYVCQKDSGFDQSTPRAILSLNEVQR